MTHAALKIQDDLLSTLVDYFEDFEEQSHIARRLSEQDRDYADHKQWTDKQSATLRRRKQPKTVNNRIRKKINWLRGLERQSRTDPKAFPRTPGHDEDAQAITDSLRFVADNVRLDKERSAFYDNFLVEGTGGAEVKIRLSEGNGEKTREIECKHVQWDRLFWDYHSRKLDFSDARYMGIIVWMDFDEAVALYPKGSVILETSFSNSIDDTYEDKPVNWVDSVRKRVRIAQIYFKHKGQWHFAIYVKAGFLVNPVPSPWLDEDGEPESGLIMQSAYVDREGHRFGEVRFMIELQDAINKRESKMLHLVSQRQTWGNKKAFPNGVKQAKRELAKPDGHVEINGQAKEGEDWGIMQTGDMADGQFTLLQESKQEFDQISVNASLTGANERSLSGRAILAQQSGGQMEITPLQDGKREWEHRIYTSFWNRIKQFWTEERWIRVTDDEKNVKFVGLNRKVTVREAVTEEMGGIPPEFEGDPRLDMISSIQNPVSEIDIDIILEDAPDTVTIQQEQFDQLAKLYQANPNGIAFDLLIEASQLRNKNKILEKMRGGSEEEQQQFAQEQQELKDIEKAGLIAKVELDRSTSMKNIADAEEDQIPEQASTAIEEAQVKAQSDIEQAKIKAQSEVDQATIKARAEVQTARDTFIAPQLPAPTLPQAPDLPDIHNHIVIQNGGDKKITLERKSDGSTVGTSTNV